MIRRIVNINILYSVVLMKPAVGDTKTHGFHSIASECNECMASCSPPGTISLRPSQ